MDLLNGFKGLFGNIPQVVQNVEHGIGNAANSAANYIPWAGPENRAIHAASNGLYDYFHSQPQGQGGQIYGGPPEPAPFSQQMQQFQPMQHLQPTQQMPPTQYMPQLPHYQPGSMPGYMPNQIQNTGLQQPVYGPSQPVYGPSQPTYGPPNNFR